MAERRQIALAAQRMNVTVPNSSHAAPRARPSRAGWSRKRPWSPAVTSGSMVSSPVSGGLLRLAIDLPLRSMRHPTTRSDDRTTACIVMAWRRAAHPSRMALLARGRLAASHVLCNWPLPTLSDATPTAGLGSLRLLPIGRRTPTNPPSAPGAARTGRSGDRPPPPDPNSRGPGRARRPRGPRPSTPPPSPGTRTGTRAARPRFRGPGAAWRSCCR